MINMKSLSKVPPWLLFAVGGAATVAYIFLVFLPNQQVIKTTNEQTQARRKTVEQQVGAAAVILDLVQQASRADAYVSLQRQNLPAEDDLVRVYGTITATAEACGLSRLSFDPQAPIWLQTLQRRPLSVRGEGTFQAICRWLARLEDLSNPVWIERLSLEPTQESDELLRCEATLSIFAGYSEDSN